MNRWWLMLTCLALGCDRPQRTVEVRGADAADPQMGVVVLQDRTEQRRGMVTGPFPDGEFTHVLKNEWAVVRYPLAGGDAEVVARIDALADSIGQVGVEARGRYALLTLSHARYGGPLRHVRIDLDTGSIKALPIADVTGCGAFFATLSDRNGTVVVTCSPWAYPHGSPQRALPQADPFPMWIETVAYGWAEVGDVWSYSGSIDGWLYVVTARPWAHSRVHPDGRVWQAVERRAFYAAVGGTLGTPRADADEADHAGVDLGHVVPDRLVVGRRAQSRRTAGSWTYDTLRVSPRRLVR